MSISAETHTQIPTQRATTTCARRRIKLDEDLVASAQQGERAAYGLLYERYQPYIAKIVGDDVRDVDARNDLSQAIFERGWHKICDLRDPKAFRPWLAQLARRLIIDHYRASSRTVLTDFSDPNSEFDLVCDGWSAHDWATMQELAADIRAALAALSARDATVLALAGSRGFDSHEIAKELNIEASHARVVLHRARRRLGQQLCSDLEAA